jgi:hypothetical protein
MSGTRKRQNNRAYRSLKGHKQATRDGCRNKSIPPDPWDDIRPDDQCFVASKMMDRMFNNGVEFEVIEKKIKNRFKLAQWQWIEINHHFENKITIQFCDELVALNSDNTSIISISTPDVEPCMVLDIDGLPLADRLIVHDDRLIRFQIRMSPPDGSWYHTGIHTVECSKLYPFPNQKLTKILVWIRDHYVENGMLYWYEVSKWKLGFDRCEIRYFDYME